MGNITRRIILFALSTVAVLFLWSAGGAQVAEWDLHPPTEPVVKGWDQVQAERLVDLIKNIQSAPAVNDASDAYAEGCAIDRQKAELHRAYMVRLLQLRQPALANAPAKALTASQPTSGPTGSSDTATSQPSDGIAWGVVGYNLAVRRDYDAALSAMLQAAEASPDNQPILRDLGQLVAWYELQKPPPTLSASDKDLLAKLKTSLAKDHAFDNAYKTAMLGQKTATTNDAKQQQKTKKDIDNAKKDLDNSSKSVADMERQAVRLTQRLRDEQDQLRLAKANPPAGTDWQQRNQRLQQLQRSIDRTQQQMVTLDQQGRDAVALRDSRQKTYDTLTGKAAPAPTAAPPINFQWEVPAVPGMADSTSKPSN